jgi:pyridoxamine 5'-phosphate oxidase-like protein
MEAENGFPVKDEFREFRRLEDLTPLQSMRLLGSVSLGRIVFTARALPAIRPVNHLVDGDYIIIRTDLSARITSELQPEAGSVVAYEADAIDPAERLGWSVIVVGVARRVTDVDKAAAYRRVLQPWVSGVMDQVIAIHTDIVTGFRLVAECRQLESARQRSQ